MANEPKKAAGAENASPVDKKFEVARTINLGGGNLKSPGDPFATSEIARAGFTIEELLSGGFITDPDTPIPPSQAEGVLAFDRMLALAQRVGVVKRDGGSLVCGGVVASGVADMRTKLSIDALEDAIAEAVSPAKRK